MKKDPIDRFWWGSTFFDNNIVKEMTDGPVYKRNDPQLILTAGTITTGRCASITATDYTPSSVVKFYDTGGKESLTINFDTGDVVLSDKISIDDSAALFWDAVIKMNPIKKAMKSIGPTAEIHGLAGNPGHKGAIGPVGMPGPIGVTGSIGAIGPVGMPGPIGVTGSIGQCAGAPTGVIPKTAEELAAEAYVRAMAVVK